MPNTSIQSILIFVLVSVLLILLLIIFLAFIFYKYREKQIKHFKNIEELKTFHHNHLLQSQLEIQEQTFQNISREIHDNIGQKLTLARLQLNTLELDDRKNTAQKTNDAAAMISEAIADLSDISRSMSSELILNNGFIKALEFEARQLEKSGLYTITLSSSGEAAFLDAHIELLLFRIVQEALNNIIKHADATAINITLDFKPDKLRLEIFDNGKGFAPQGNTQSGTGLINMKKRAHNLQGILEITSQPGRGTLILIEIPIYEYKSESQDHTGR